MKEFFKNPAVYAIIAYCLLFIFSAFTFGAESIKTMIDYVVVAVSLLFFFKWWPNTWEAFKGGGIQRKFRLSLGLSLIAAGLAGQRIWIILVNNPHIIIPDWVDKNAVSGFIGSWFIGAMLLCLSIDSPDEGITTHLKWYYRFILIGFGSVAGFIVARLLFP